MNESTDKGLEQSLVRQESKSVDQVQIFREMLDIEHLRIESANRRTDVALKAIEASDAADKRQYDYHVEKLRQRGKDRSQRHKSTFRFLWALLISLGIGGALVLSMLFFGTEQQRGVAMSIMETLATALGGAGVFWLVRAMVMRVVNGPRDE